MRYTTHKLSGTSFVIKPEGSQRLIVVDFEAGVVFTGGWGGFAPALVEESNFTPAVPEREHWDKSIEEMIVEPAELASGFVQFTLLNREGERFVSPEAGETATGGYFALNNDELDYVMEKWDPASSSDGIQEEVKFTIFNDDLPVHIPDRTIKVVDLSRYPVLTDTWQHPEVGQVDVYLRYEQRENGQGQVKPKAEAIWTSSQGEKPMRMDGEKLHCGWPYIQNGNEVTFNSVTGIFADGDAVVKMNHA
jgi:hypothetical protein